MVTHKLSILLFVLSFSLLSCGSIPKKMRQAFVSCHEEKDTGIDSLINMDGYYLTSIPMMRGVLKSGWSSELNYVKDTFTTSLMFYRNGLMIKGLGDTNMNRLHYDSIRQQYVGGNTPLALKEIAENPQSREAQNFYMQRWGNYIICGDTIKIQYVDKPFPLAAKLGREEWYKVIDRNTILRILSLDLEDNANPESRLLKSKEMEPPAIFIPIPLKPSPDGAWILKEKWFWCNEQDWKAYKEKIKKKK